MIDKGVCLVLLWLQPPIFAHQTMPSLIMLEAGVILHFTTLTSLSLFSNTLLITKLELSLFLTEGKICTLKFYSLLCGTICFVCCYFALCFGTNVVLVLKSVKERFIFSQHVSI